MAEPFVYQLRVRYAECDPQGVLFNANYLAYVDHTITELWRAAFGGYKAMLDRGVDIVVAEANLRFLGSARFDEEIDDRGHRRPTSGTTSVRPLVPLPARRPELLLEATLRHVFIDRATATKTRDARLGARRAGAVAGPGAQADSDAP